MKCWHFAGETLRDGRPLPRKGDTLTHQGAIVPCESGYHGSVRALDALRYAPGVMVALVELGGTIREHGNPVDKLAASERTNLADYVDATRVLHEFACWCATRALDVAEASGRKVDPRSRAAIATKIAWLDGEATGAERYAAWYATGDAARDAARYAARDAARYAARDAARAAQNAELERRLLALMEVR